MEEAKLTVDDYQKICQETAKKYDDKEKEIMNWGLGISGEAGDVASCIKKTVAHKNNQLPGIKENLGDTLWYISMICNFYGWKLSDVMKENTDKLRKRFPEGFSIKKAKREMIDWTEDE